MILVIGATGVLGRPVARALIEHGYRVRALARDVPRARRILPDPVVIVRGDLRDAASLEQAMHGVDAIYLNLSHPFSARTPYDAERDGVPAVIAAARAAGVRRLLKISSLGVPEAKDAWWLIDRKRVSDDQTLNSGLDATVFRPTWFMESLPLFAVGSLLLAPAGLPRAPLHWIAGVDYGRQVAAAIDDPETYGGVYAVQGPEPVAFDAALRRFQSAVGRRLLRLPVPMTALRLAAPASAKTRYLVDLLDMTFAYAAGFQAEATWSRLGPPTMTIEDYAASIDVTGDWPSKPAF